MESCLYPRERFARICFSLWAAFVGIGGITRLAIATHERASFTLGELLRVVSYGTAIDALVALALIAPLAAAFSLSRRTSERSRLRFVLITAAAAVTIFGGFVEFFFFEEFDARFNHVALDYVLFPDEVVGNVWESYPVPLYLAFATLGGGLIALAIQRFLRGSSAIPASFGSRARRAGTCLLLGGTAVAALVAIPMRTSGDRTHDEISANGLVQLGRAFATSGLDYASYYRTVPADELAQHAHDEVGFPSLDDPAKTFVAADRRDTPLDIVVILGESFGSEFVGRLGGSKPCAPGFERWADRGTLLTNLVATGNRTVRGLEGVLCSFVPLPGDSIWKREKSDDVASIARVLKEQGYRTEFVYGGDGAFDGMRSFALRNGWDEFREDSMIGASSYSEEAFRTVWGVADEDVFSELLARQRDAAKDGTRFFGTALTVSNHKPFLTPDTASTALRGEKLLTAGWQGAILLALTLLAWRYLAPPGRRARFFTIAGFVWIAFSAFSWSKAQPRDSRENAVRYADRALADYLDRAEAEGLLEHTVVLFVGDHGARVYGSEEIPAASYRIPALFVAPDAKHRGAIIPRLASQIDLAPTLLSMAGIDYAAPFFGEDLLASPPDGPGRAWLIHNRNIGLLTDTELTVLGLRRTITHYRRESRESDRFELMRESPQLARNADRAASVFQAASVLYEGRRYRLPDVP